MIWLNSSSPHYDMGKAKSFFKDGACLDGTWTNYKFAFLKRVLNENFWFKNPFNHVQFQELLFYYTWEDLDNYLCENWFQLVHTFDSSDEISFYLEKNPDLKHKIASWKLKIWLLYKWLVPIKVILSEQTQDNWTISEKINLIREEIKRDSWDLLKIAL